MFLMPVWLRTLWKALVVFEVLIFWSVAWDMAAYSWEGASAPIRQIAAEAVTGGRGDRVFPQYSTPLYSGGTVIRARYVYQVGDKLYESDNVWIGGNATSRKGGASFIRELDSGRITHAHVRVRSPGDAVLFLYPSFQVVLERLLLPLAILASITCFAYFRARVSS